MDVNHETLRIVRNIDRKQDVIVSQTAPRMPQLWAAITGLVVCAVGSFVLDKGDVPFCRLCMNRLAITSPTMQPPQVSG